MKTLRVCLSSELPPMTDRTPDYLYFTYDKLYLYHGQNLMSDNFAIASEIPEAQVTGMIYILDTDGSVHRKDNYSDEVIAEIETPAQIELLKKAGTMFYINADHRYIDSQRRSLTLPFNDGTYELNVSTKNDAVYDNNTILKFNEKNNRFEMYSDTSEDFIDYSKIVRGGSTNTVDMSVNGPRLYGNVKVSNMAGNIIRKSSDGIFAKSDNLLEREEFNEWVTNNTDFRKYALNVLSRLEQELNATKQLVNRDTILNEIIRQLSARYPSIEVALDNYDDFKATLDAIETDLITYAEENIREIRTYLYGQFDIYSNWNNLDDSHETFEHEVNFYEKAEEWFYPDLPLSKRKVLIGTGIAQHLASYPVTDYKMAIIAAAIQQYKIDFPPPTEEEKAIISTAIHQYILDNPPPTDEQKAIISAAINQYLIDNPPPTEEDKALIATAVAKYVSDYPVSDSKASIIASAIAQYITDNTP